MASTVENIDDTVNDQQPVSQNMKDLPHEAVQEYPRIIAKVDDRAWTTGGDPDVSHRNVIDAGATGEVHEAFARKLMRPMGDITQDHINNEIRASVKLCKTGAHKNIVAVFDLGNLPNTIFYFIDMELCDMNLDTYIYSRSTPKLVDKIPYFFNATATERAAQIKNIMLDIANGLVFIHDHNEVHRDLKPHNVLYSCLHKTWKVTDFGLTMTATSKKLYTTRYARGTSSYRAPELVHERSTFNNKVDIWAAGCILFEVVFAKKAFTNDHAVQDYESNTSFYGTGFKMPERTDIQLDMRSISSIIQQAFSTAPSNRPSAKELLVSLDAAFAEDEEELMSDMSTTTEEEVETRVDTPPPQMRESTLVRKYYLMAIDTSETTTSTLKVDIGEDSLLDEREVPRVKSRDVGLGTDLNSDVSLGDERTVDQVDRLIVKTDVGVGTDTIDQNSSANHQAFVGSCSSVTVNLENTHMAGIITEKGSGWRQVVLWDTRTARVQWTYDHPQRRWIPPPAFDVTGKEFFYHNGESEVEVVSLSDPPRSTHRFSLPFLPEQVRALAMSCPLGVPPPSTHRFSFEPFLPEQVRFGVAIGVLAPRSRRIEITSEEIEVSTGRTLPMDIVQVPRVDYDEAGTPFLVYSAAKNILFVVFSDQLGVVVVNSVNHSRQQLSRLEYFYNSAIDFLDGIRVYGTSSFRNDDTEFQIVEECLVLTVPMKKTWTGLFRKGSGDGRKAVAISALGHEIKTLQKFEGKHVQRDITISSSKIYSCSWQHPRITVSKLRGGLAWMPVPLPFGKGLRIVKSLPERGRIALSTSEWTLLKEDGEMVLLTDREEENSEPTMYDKD